MDELIAIYGTDTLDPPGSHIAVAIVGGVYLVLVIGFALGWVLSQRATRRARSDRRSVLEPGPTQLHGQIVDEGWKAPGPAVGETVVEQRVEPFVLETSAGPVRVAPTRPVRFFGGDTGGAPLKGGHYVEVAGGLAREKRTSAEGYRGDAAEEWVLSEGAGEPVRLWRHSRSMWPARRRDAALGGLLAALVLAVLSALSLTGYLARLALGETTRGTLVAVAEHERELELAIDLGDGEPVLDTVRADELERWSAGAPIAYRRVPALPCLGAVGPGAAVPSLALFWAILFLFAAIASSMAILAMVLDGG